MLGTLYNVLPDQDKNEAVIAHAFSTWEVVHPIEQYLSNVLKVSTFWPANDDAGNG